MSSLILFSGFWMKAQIHFLHWPFFCHITSSSPYSLQLVFLAFFQDDSCLLPTNSLVLSHHLLSLSTFFFFLMLPPHLLYWLAHILSENSRHLCEYFLGSHNLLFQAVKCDLLYKPSKQYQHLCNTISLKVPKIQQYLLCKYGSAACSKGTLS